MNKTLLLISALALSLSACNKKDEEKKVSDEFGNCTYIFAENFNALVTATRQMKQTATAQGVESTSTADAAQMLKISCGVMAQKYSNVDCSAEESMTSKTVRITSNTYKNQCEYANVYVQNKISGKAQAAKVVPEDAFLKYIDPIQD